MNSSPAPTKRSTPDRLMDVAQAMFVKNGYHGVAVDKIIAQTGVSKGTFFYHFKSKEDLAQRLLERYFERIAAAANAIGTAAAQQSDDPWQILDICLTEFENLFNGRHVQGGADESLDGCLMAAFSYQLFNDIPSLRAISAQAINRFSTAYAPLFDEVLATANSPVGISGETLSKHYFALMQGTLLVSRIDPAWTDFKQQVDSFKKMLNALLK
ncbi:TetR/AcrR family transcriptional regulator [Saccharophagus degradans]|uniref:TetR/AcrR family transcriptional regulator n=1 Tax=Saccharophagus degradans TaxID=86304 RepID=A0AAW7X6H3_9GAMM|nr:TetR/AcrR family transcriptional regulator [Saccharophagus degradans]MDO6423435.1 TetR/AcrR family transcriptional regulator [Saccharophagus degradans]MDO6606840.1 TetR/AcrR family transcriptional regulator [Saccharophagus degradans]